MPRRGCRSRRLRWPVEVRVLDVEGNVTEMDQAVALVTDIASLEEAIPVFRFQVTDATEGLPARVERLALDATMSWTIRDHIHAYAFVLRNLDENAPIQIGEVPLVVEGTHADENLQLVANFASNPMLFADGNSGTVTSVIDYEIVAYYSDTDVRITDDSQITLSMGLGGLTLDTGATSSQLSPVINSDTLVASYAVALIVEGTKLGLAGVHSDVDAGGDDYRYIVPSGNAPVFPSFRFVVELIDAHGNLDLTAGLFESMKDAMTIYLDRPDEPLTSVLTTGAYTFVKVLEPGVAEISVTDEAVRGKFQERVKALGSADADGSQWNARIDIADARGSTGAFTVDIHARRFAVENAALDVGFSHNAQSRLSFDIRYFGIDDLQDVDPIGQFLPVRVEADCIDRAACSVALSDVSGSGASMMPMLTDPASTAPRTLTITLRSGSLPAVTLNADDVAGVDGFGVMVQPTPMLLVSARDTMLTQTAIDAVVMATFTLSIVDGYSKAPWPRKETVALMATSSDGQKPSVPETFEVTVGGSDIEVSITPMLDVGHDADVDGELG